MNDSANFGCGDLHIADKSRLFIAPARDDKFRSNAIRLYDFTAECVVGLLLGSTGEISVGKQYCVESHNSFFSMSGGAGVMFDMRTFRPSIALHSCDEQILGIPTNSAPVAFTYGSQEHIKCWDIRMPGSHVYTMATGNTEVDTLLWHQGTASLIASTRSKHHLTHGRYSSYMYGQQVDLFKDEDAFDWPSGAVHDRKYFGHEWHSDCAYSYKMLQYTFENGMAMHGSENVRGDRPKKRSKQSDQ